MKKKKEIPDAEAPGGVKVYREYTDDFVQSRQQDAGLPDGYVWYHENRGYRFASGLIYALVLVYTFFYSRLCLPVRVENREILKDCKDTGFFLYGNHTQPVGDAFVPVRCAFPRRVHTIMGTANLGIPVLGKMLPILGGLAVPDSIDGMKEFIRSIEKHLKKRGCIMVFPEAHVWPWCDFVRPFADTSFRYPVMFHVPVFCMTMTYQKRKHSKKPRVTVFLDGPFYPDADLEAKKAQKKLHDDVFACMQERSSNSTYEYVKYVKESDK